MSTAPESIDRNVITTVRPTEGKRDIPGAATGTATSYGELGTFDVKILKADAYADYSYVEDSLEMEADSYKYFDYVDVNYYTYAYAPGAAEDEDKGESILLPPPAASSRGL
jgi:hypothetical protein